MTARYTPYHTLNAVLAIPAASIPAALEAFARNEQASRDEKGKTTWQGYRLSGPWASVVNPKGAIYTFVQAWSDQGQVRFEGCPDQAFCDAVNDALKAHCSRCLMFRLVTKHDMIRRRLLEVDAAGKKG